MYRYNSDCYTCNTLVQASAHSHAQNAVKWLALSKRSVEAPQKHVSCMIRQSWVLHAMHLLEPVLLSRLHFYLQLHLYLMIMHASCTKFYVRRCRLHSWASQTKRDSNSTLHDYLPCFPLSNNSDWYTCSKQAPIPIPAPTPTCVVLFLGFLLQNTNTVIVVRVTFLTLAVSRVQKGLKDLNCMHRTEKRAKVLDNLLTHT